MEVKMRSLNGIDLRGKKVLLRPDINSPVDPVTKKIVNDNRIVVRIAIARRLRIAAAISQGIEIVGVEVQSLDADDL